MELKGTDKVQWRVLDYNLCNHNNQHIMNENLFRISMAVLIFAAVGISSYFRLKADKETGEKIPRKADGAAMMTIIKIGGLILWMAPIVYILNPHWMAWAGIGLPPLARWVGVGAGAVCVAMIYWLFSSIGNNISPTSATRRQHKLVTHGPYRWIRHPLYTIGAITFLSFGLIADNWLIMLLGVLVFVVMAARTPKEEANLIEKFGEEYKAYMKRAGRFLPRLFR